MNAAPKPVRPARKFETYVIDLPDGSTTIELPAAEVDRNGGHARVGNIDLVIQWRGATNA
jgi:hypothetical protein